MSFSNNDQYANLTSRAYAASDAEDKDILAKIAKERYDSEKIDNDEVKQIIIVGAGSLGRELYKAFDEEEESVVMIENDNVLIEEAKSHGIDVIEGVPFDRDVLLEAGINSCDVLLAVKRDEVINLLVAQIAVRNFNVKRAIVRLQDPDKAEYFTEGGRIACYSSNEWAVHRILQQIHGLKNVSAHHMFGKRIVYSSYAVPQPFIGEPLNELHGYPDRRLILIGAERQGVLHPISDDMLLKADDRLIFLGVE